MRKTTKIKASYDSSTVVAGLLSGALGFLAFGPIGALITGGIVGACCHGKRKDELRYETNDSILSKKEDELCNLIKETNPEKKKVSVKSFIRGEEDNDWYERKSIYRF